MPALLRDDRGAVRVLTIDNAKKRNALDPAILRALAAECDAAAADPGVSVVVLRGAGDKAFSSGYDLEALPSTSTDELPDKLFTDAVARVELLPKPTIAFLNGHAFGGGLDLACACDLRVAREGISLGMPPAKLGLVYALDGLARFARLVGFARAKELFFTGAPVDAPRALELGLVDRLLPAAEAEAGALALAEQLAQNAPLALQGMKEGFRRLARGEGDADGAFRAMRKRAFDSADAREGRAAFTEKRPPRFRGE